MIILAQNTSFLQNWWGWLIGVGVLLVLILLAVWITSGNKRFQKNYNSTMKIIFGRRWKGQINEEEFKKRMEKMQPGKDNSAENK